MPILNNFRYKASQDRGVFVPPVAATDSLSINNIAVSNKEVEIIVKQENLPRQNQVSTLASTQNSMGPLQHHDITLN